MIRNLSVRAGTALVIGVAVLGLSGCGKVIDADAVQKSVSDWVAKKTDFTPTDMKCPSGLDAKVGAEFDCKFTGPDGDYLAHVKVTKVDGSDLEYDIETKRA